MKIYTGYPNHKANKNGRNNGNSTKRTDLHETAINSMKRSHCHLFLKQM